MSSDFRQQLAQKVTSEEPLLRAYLKQRVGRPEDINDYVQEVYARILTTPPKTAVSSWQGLLRRVAANLLIDQIRRDRTGAGSAHVGLDGEFDLPDGRPSPGQSIMARQRLEAVTDILKQLPPIARSVFLLVRVEGLSHRAAAERLGLDVRSVSRHVERVLVLVSRRMVEGLLEDR
jgi:RNA polymerase sigma-70 factor (ECF subfamily)